MTPIQRLRAKLSFCRPTLSWLSRAKSVTEDMEAVWNVVCGLKDIVIHLLEAENDGIRTYTIKFMEMLVITQTPRETESNTGSTKGGAADFSLDDVPLTLKIARRRKLQARLGMFDKLIFEIKRA